MNIMNGVSKVKEIMNFNFHTLFRLNKLLEIFMVELKIADKYKGEVLKNLYPILKVRSVF